MMKPYLSVVVPVFNEEAVLEAFFARLDGVLREIGKPYEIIFIDDGSRDHTAAMLRALARQHAAVKALHFSRNFGHQIALTAGLDVAAGEIVVTMDADLQNPPEVLPQMLAKVTEGYDVVYGTHAGKKGVMRKLHHRALRLFVNFTIPQNTGDFRLATRRAVDAVRAMPERDRFLRGMFAWVGFRQAEVYYARPKRYAGKTKYTLRKRVRLATNGILSFSLKPLDWITWLGLFGVVIGGLWLLMLLGMHIGGVLVQASAALYALGILLTGIVLGCMGMMGAYLGRIYDEIKGRPLYVIAECSDKNSEHFSKE